MSALRNFTKWLDEQSAEVQDDILEYAYAKYRDGESFENTSEFSANSRTPKGMRVAAKLLLLAGWQDDIDLCKRFLLTGKPIQTRFTMGKAAAILGVSRKTLYNRIKAGKYSAADLGRVVPNRGNPYFDAEAILDFAAHEHWRNAEK